MISAIFAILFLYVAYASATCSGLCCPNGTNYNIVCVSSGGSCYDTAGADIVFCKNSYRNGDQSTSGCVCEPFTQIGQVCTTSTLDTSEDLCQSTSGNVFFDTFCNSGTCNYGGGAIGAGGEGLSCSGVTDANYVGGNSCINGQKCSSGCGTVVATHAGCDNIANFCGHGDFCFNGNCTNRNSVGCNGTSSTSCSFDKICNQGTCIAAFSVSSGSACSTDAACSGGAYCYNGVCTAVKGGSCTIGAANTCNGYEVCECNGDSGNSGTCAYTVFEDPTAVTNLLNCMGSSSCTADLPWADLLLSGVFVHSPQTAQLTPDACFWRTCESTFSTLYAQSALDPCDSVALSISAILVLLTTVVAFMF